MSDEKIDGLTGLPNRHAFDTRLDELCGGSHEGGESLVLALIDVDRMKRVSDEYGQQARDLALRQICEMICSRLKNVLQ